MKKTRMVQLLTELLSNKIMFPFASEIIGGAAEMKEKCEEREEEDDEMNKRWDELDQQLYALLRQAKRLKIEGKQTEDKDTRITELEAAVKTDAEDSDDESDN